MVALIVTIILMLAVSFVCSLSEAALYAVPAVHVETLRQDGSSLGRRLGRLRERIEQPITAILFLNTFANTMGAAIAGGLYGEHYNTHGVWLFSLVLTLAVLLIGEIVPKSLGVGYARRLIGLLTWPIQAMVWMLYPLVRGGEAMMRFLMPRQRAAGPSEEDILTATRMGVRGGTILPREAHWVAHVLKLNDVTAADIMTPRPVMTTLTDNLTIGELRERISSIVFSRIPVTSEDGPDHITGIVLRRRIVNNLLAGKLTTRLSELQIPAKFVPATMHGHQLLHFFITERMHLAIVVDEYGGTMGLVTLEDVLEAMIGEEIVGEFDPHPDLRQYARERALAGMKDS